MKKCLVLTLCVLLCFAAGCAQQATPSQSQSESESTQEPAPTTPAPPPEEPSPWAIGPDDPVPPSEPPWVREPQEVRPLTDLTKNTIQITITMENGGVIVAELYPDVAPQTVRNFVYLARLGFYDGLKFHRIMSGFMLQGGCPYTRDGAQGYAGTGNPGYAIWGEFTSNGFRNEIRHVRGVLSTARSDDPNTAGSQFFIIHETSAHLNNNYAAFGKVLSGMEVVDELAATPVIDDNGTVEPGNMPVIRSITVDSDVELPLPEKLRR